MRRVTYVGPGGAADGRTCSRTRRDPKRYSVAVSFVANQYQLHQGVQIVNERLPHQGSRDTWRALASLS